MAEPSKGKLVLWNDGKGFGFVRHESDGKDLFLHISAIRNYRKGLSRRPAVGDIVHYQPLSHEEVKGQRRISAAMVIGINDAVFGIDAESGSWWSVLGLKLLAGAPILLSFYLIWRTGNPIPLISYIFMSALSSLYYAVDKRRALMNAWRIPEIYLHCFELLGGWPGALLSQKAFRHKKKKGDYQRVFWEIVTLHGLIWLVYLYFDLTRHK
ncbi:MAG: DUF1294 domain-containing protein [Proteobacteria bacterium]|nr:DUF1294 domain-containing protein [Pseudomonadota bacterium]